MKKPTLLIMAGGTGGHIFPALAIAEAMSVKDWKVEWMGTPGGMEMSLVPKAGYRLHKINFEGVVGKGWAARALLPLRLARALLQARSIFKAVKPNLVLGMGGYPALPGGLLAGWMGIPLVIHEQNAVAGKTNLALCTRATRVLSAFPHAFKAKKVQAQVVGNPVRRDIVQVGAERVIWDRSRPLVISIVGGSRGAQALNDVIPNMIARLPKGLAVRVFHQCGRGHVDAVRNAYRAREIDADVREFVDDMAALYAKTDLIICRSGASTVSELACAEVPSILVPYPFHADQQQLHNARYLTAAGGAILMEQKDLSPEMLAHTIENISPQQLTTMRSILRTNAHPESAQVIADILNGYRRPA
jgi:UDP-N-acetylglucosamine--N-acetylmuramyl-(pentapeptide) pyrophosphoryl-undecaprenol N-acetylglucosamine transferase